MPHKWVGFGLISCHCLLALSIALIAETASAHGGGVARLTNAEAGPYRLFVWTTPEPLLVGEVHITISVVQASSDSRSDEANRRDALDIAVTDANVQVRFEQVAQPATVFTLQAGHADMLNNLFYEADTELTAVGDWRISIIVEGAEGRGEAAFEASIGQAREPNWPLIGGASVALIVIILLMLWWSHTQGAPRQQRHRPDARRSRA